ncbi:GntR family transcriptional regulator [Streptomyces sp. SBT349]|uniref:GntR family transcriptional regulator n=1 Tax=Streptomyces sp. SBT349 TaxID=1580539 RepID=UPI000A92A92B
MADNWATFRRSLDLHVPVDLRRGGRGTGAALVRALREAVRGGRLAPGTRLPSSRALAADLGVARNTVGDAYAELVAEGWLTARQGSGTRVAERVAPRRERPHAPGRFAPSLGSFIQQLRNLRASFRRAAQITVPERMANVSPLSKNNFFPPRAISRMSCTTNGCPPTMS